MWVWIMFFGFFIMVCSIVWMCCVICGFIVWCIWFCGLLWSRLSGISLLLLVNIE